MTASSTCATFEELADWWAGALPRSRSDSIEEHLLACERCARRGARVGDLARAVEAAMRRGAVSGPTMPGILARLERDGLRVHRYGIAPGQVVPCSVWPDDEIMAAVLDVRSAAGEDASRFDLLTRVGAGPPSRTADVPLDRTTGTLTWLSAASVERQLPATRISFRLLRVTGKDESPAGDYALAHEPWAGPASPR